MTSLCFLATALAGCATTPKPFADDGWSEAPDLTNLPPQGTVTMAVEPATPAPPDSPSDGVQITPLTKDSPAPRATSTAPTIVGVRHDLRLAPAETREARCNCLAVEVAPATSPLFAWPDAQPPEGAGLAIAVSAQGVSCSAKGPATRRPSISAVEFEGSDLVVEVEELPSGIPLASGALLPELPPGGSVYVRARSKKVPYARPGRCKVHGG